MRLMWKREPSTHGLMRITQGNRGHDLILHIKTEKELVASIRPKERLDPPKSYWVYVCATKGFPHRNTWSKKYWTDLEKLKKDLKAGVQARIKLPEEK